MHIKGMILISFFFRSNTKLGIIKQMKLHRLQVITETVILELSEVFFSVGCLFWVSGITYLFSSL